MKVPAKEKSDHFTYRISWSEEDGEHVATCAEFPSLSHLAADPAEALQGIRDLVRNVVEDMRANGERVPVPLADANYSGKFVARVPPELHRRLAIEAAVARVSMNRLISHRLAMAPIETAGRLVGDVESSFSRNYGHESDQPATPAKPTKRRQLATGVLHGNKSVD